MKKRSFSVRQVVFHPSSLAVFSGLFGAGIGFLINLVSGGQSSSMIWIALTFAIIFSLSITAWQVFSQDKTDQHLMAMLQEMVFQTTFLTVLADKPEISRMAKQRLNQVFKTFSGEQQISMLKFFSASGLAVTFVGDAMRGSDALVGADLHQIALPHVNIEQTDLRGVNFSDANLLEAQLQGAWLANANLSGADLRQSDLKQAALREANLRGANLSGADLSGADLSEANLQGTNLSGADLSGTALLKANLQEADLSGADLTGAALIDAILDGADLRAAKVSEEQLSLVRSSKDMKRED
jgi:uncharacterized protein YjbI with pentapeptide repeats